tara:strand:+ start:9994 stop:10410 length:417 start_codon:yes stop_codon:yes gene_type:complete
MRAPFINKDGLYFKIYRESMFSGMGRFFGMQNLEIGDPYFDDAFVIKGNDAHKLKQMLADPELKSLFDQQRSICLEVKDDEGWFGGNFPQGVDELYFSRVGVMKDVHELKALFKLFCAVPDRLVRIDSAYENDPNVTL